MKNFLVILTVLTLFCASPVMAQTVLKKVLISQVVEHPALDSTTKGIMDGLAQNGYTRGVNLDIRIESAQGNPALAAQIAAKFMNQNPDVVVGVGTLSAQSFAKYASVNKVKMVFSSVTDPLQAGLVKSLNEPGNNTSGISNFVALEPQLQLFKKIQPSLKRLGILYNAGELNSVSIIQHLEVLCPKLGIVLVKQTANKTADMAQAATKLAGRVDAIFISNDNTALSALQSVLMASNKAKIPVYLSDTAAVERGALAALGPNQYQVGLQSAKLIARSLKGDAIGTIPVAFPTKIDLSINEEAAKNLGIHIPSDIRHQATQIIEKYTS